MTKNMETRAVTHDQNTWKSLWGIRESVVKRISVWKHRPGDWGPDRGIREQPCQWPVIGQVG